MPVKTKTIQFTKEADKKNAVKFAEVATEGNAPVCGTIYLQRWFCGAATNVTVEVQVQ